MDNTPDGRNCVISLGINGSIPANHPEVLFQDFPGGIARIKSDLCSFNFRGEFIYWDKYYPEGSPRHKDAPGGFKPFCFDEARKLHYQLILWLDASVRIKLPIEPLFGMIRQDGYLIFEEGHTVGEYCSDMALETLKITREESFIMPSCWSCAIGLNLADARSIEYLQQWKEKAVDGITFPGAKWSGIYGWPVTVSVDPRVKGHRHDQTAASVIALKLGMKEWKSRLLFDEYFTNDRESVRKLRDVYVKPYS
jgi:hypothetical protein